MLPRMAKTETTADRLLDAQVKYVVDQLTGDQLQANISRDVDAALALVAEVRIDEVVGRAEVKRIAKRLVATIPATTGASELVLGAVDVVYAGPAEPFAVGELVARDQVAALVDEVLGMSHIGEQLLDELTNSPLVATVASRFMARIVGDVLQANRAVAEKIPGIGSLMSFGTSAASRMMGAADKQFEQLLGDTAGKGATFAMRRLNKIVMETLRDPTTRDAVLEVWDMYAKQPVVGLGRFAEQEDVYRLVQVVQELVAIGAATAHAAGLVDAFVDEFFNRYGEYPVTRLLDELEISRDDLVADLQALAPTVFGAAAGSGALERLVRERLEPFYRSAAVTEILGG